MTTRTLHIISALSMTWGAVASAAPDDFISPLIGSLEAGVLCAQDSGIARDAPDTVAGTTHIVENAPPFISTGRVVPAVIGVGFGVKSSVMMDGGLDTVRMTVTHPPLFGSGATEQSFITSIGAQGAPGITFYQFDYDYELALGDWTMTASAGGMTLYQQTFTVVAPSLLPELAGLCGYSDYLS